jgi:hypothetical protein
LGCGHHASADPAAAAHTAAACAARARQLRREDGLGDGKVDGLGAVRVRKGSVGEVERARWAEQVACYAVVGDGGVPLDFEVADGHAPRVEADLHSPAAALGRQRDASELRRDRAVALLQALHDGAVARLHEAEHLQRLRVRRRLRVRVRMRVRMHPLQLLVQAPLLLSVRLLLLVLLLQLELQLLLLEFADLALVELLLLRLRLRLVLLERHLRLMPLLLLVLHLLLLLQVQLPLDERRLRQNVFRHILCSVRLR